MPVFYPLGIFVYSSALHYRSELRTYRCYGYSSPLNFEFEALSCRGVEDMVGQDAGRRMIKKYENVIIEGVDPEIDCGRYPVKREIGDRLEVGADIFKDGHDVIAAVVKHREKGKRKWVETRMQVVNPGLDRWSASFDLPENTSYEYTIEAWMDEYGSWLREVGKKVEAGQNVELELIEGRELVAEAAGRASTAVAKELQELLTRLDKASYEERLSLLRSDETRELMYRYADRSASTVYKTLEVTVDRVAARYAAWYEMFHRSQGTEPGRGATFREAEKRLPEIAGMGFDVIYLLPIHPIGTTHRKGRNKCPHRRSRRPRQPLRHRERGGRTQSRQPGTRNAGGLPAFRRGVRRARDGGGVGLRHPVFPGPSVHKRASRVVQVPARRHDKVRREPAEEVPGHRERGLGVGGLGEPLAGVARRGAVLGRAGRESFPGGQPAHQAVRVLGVVDPGRSGRSTRR